MIGTPDPTNPEYSVWTGFAFIWNPDFSQLNDPKIWLAAAGQIFFTLSVGMGTIHAYASYLNPKTILLFQDCLQLQQMSLQK
jgi:neurotransmitter:Na+ symporter, NSS family